jgi:C_GCAxxG_C_C family probable redox protein
MKVNNVEVAQTLFNQGFNCAQALLTTYGIDLGLNRNTALKIASAFGGGIGCMGETCGAVTGALMVLGLKYGTTEPGIRTKAKMYEIADEFVKKFRARNHAYSIECRTLLGFTICSGRDLNPDEREVIMTKCPQFVQDAADVIEDLMGRGNEKNKEEN